LREGFDTTTRSQLGDDRRSARDLFRHYRPQVVVCVAAVVLLVGGALYSARISESAPRVVYSASLDEVATAGQQPLKVNINTADAEKLDELPEVGPATAESIIQYRRTNGLFSSVDELEEVPGIGPTTLEQIKPFATV